MGHLEIEEERKIDQKKNKKTHRMEVSKENDLSPVGLKRPKGKLRRPRRFFQNAVIWPGKLPGRYPVNTGLILHWF